MGLQKTRELWAAHSWAKPKKDNYCHMYFIIHSLTLAKIMLCIKFVSTVFTLVFYSQQ